MSEGSRVAMLSRGADRLQAAASEIGPSAAAFPTDIVDPQAVLRTFAAIQHQYGGIDILINNAAVGHLQSIEEASDPLLLEEIGANLLGPIYCIRSAIPLMRVRGGGDIVNVSSESVRAPYPFLSVYAATKGAVETLSVGLRAELREDKIRVSVLRSGRLTESGFNRSWPEDRRARYRQIVAQQGYHAASGEPISPQIAARAVVNLVCLPRESSIHFIELRPS